MKLSFEPPTIIGALCERERQIPAGLKRRFARKKPRFAFLPFEVERRTLKNTVACMQLMDIRGLAVFGGLQREIVRHLPRLAPSARRAGQVDLVLRKGRQFEGRHLLTEIQGNQKGTPRRTHMGLFCQAAVDLLTAPSA